MNKPDSNARNGSTKSDNISAAKNSTGAIRKTKIYNHNNGTEHKQLLRELTISTLKRVKRLESKAMARDYLMGRALPERALKDFTNNKRNGTKGPQKNRS